MAVPESIVLWVTDFIPDPQRWGCCCLASMFPLTCYCCHQDGAFRCPQGLVLVWYCFLPQNDLPHMVRTSLAVWLSSSSILIPFPQYFCNTPEALLNPADLWLSLVILLAEFAVGKIPLHLCCLLA